MADNLRYHYETKEFSGHRYVFKFTCFGLRENHFDFSNNVWRFSKEYRNKNLRYSFNVEIYGGKFDDSMRKIRDVLKDNRILSLGRTKNGDYVLSVRSEVGKKFPYSAEMKDNGIKVSVTIEGDHSALFAEAVERRAASDERIRKQKLQRKAERAENALFKGIPAAKPPKGHTEQLPVPKHLQWSARKPLSGGGFSPK